jgi:hypothetical protein
VDTKSRNIRAAWTAVCGAVILFEGSEHTSNMQSGNFSDASNLNTYIQIVFGINI